MKLLSNLIGCSGIVLTVALSAFTQLKAELTLSIEAPPLVPGGTAFLSLTLDEAAGIAGADIIINVPEFLLAGPAETTPATSGFLIASKSQPGQVKVSLARARGLELQRATIVRIPVTVAKTATAGTITLNASLSRFYSDQPAIVASKTMETALTILNLAPDVDGDGLPDDWETQHFGGIQFNGMTDQDGDGLSDAAEFRAATDPRDANSVFGLIKYGKIESPSGPMPMIQWEAKEGRSYSIEWSDSPVGPAMRWRRVYNPIIHREGALASWHDDGSRTLIEPSAIRERYYRVVLNQD